SVSYIPRIFFFSGEDISPWRWRNISRYSSTTLSEALPVCLHSGNASRAFNCRGQPKGLKIHTKNCRHSLTGLSRLRISSVVPKNFHPSERWQQSWHTRSGIPSARFGELQRSS